jgi:glutamate-1-semialdehyde 2,1-aminomutase
MNTKERRMTTTLERYRALHPRSAALHEQDLREFPNGVTHDIRYFEPFPIYVEHAAGSRKWDVDGNELIDYVMGHGALLLGHAHPALVDAVTRQIQRGTHYGACHELEMEWASWIKRLVPCAETVRFTSCGTEATMMSARLARAFTGRSKLVRFAFNFHGWNDSVTGFTAPEETLPRSPGVPDAVLGQQIILPQNGRDELARTLASDHDVAAVILEPTGASAGTIPIDPDFLPFLREQTERHNVVLIFDEVVTGFRVSPGGAQAYYGVIPDLTTLAKIVGGGIPGAAVVGRDDLLSRIEFRDDAEWNLRDRISHPGTYNGNPLSAASGVAMLSHICDGDPQQRAADLAKRFCQEANRIIRQAGVKGCVYAFSSMFHMSIGVDCPEPIDGYLWNWEGRPGPVVPMTPPAVATTFRQEMINRGVDFMRMGGMMSAVHTESDVDATLSALSEALSMLKDEAAA